MAGPLDIAVLERRNRPGTPGVGLADHGELQAARGGAQPVGRDRHDRVELHHIVEFAGLQSGRRGPLQQRADGLAPFCLVGTTLQHAIGREEIGDIVPHPADLIIAIGILDCEDPGLVVEPRHAAREVSRVHRRARGRRPCLRHIRARQADRVDIEMKRHGAHDRIDRFPAALISAREHRIRLEELEFPDPVLQHIDILLDRPLPAGPAAI